MLEKSNMIGKRESVVCLVMTTIAVIICQWLTYDEDEEQPKKVENNDKKSSISILNIINVVASIVSIILIWYVPKLGK